MPFHLSNETNIFFVGVLVGNLLTPIFLPLITGMACGGFMSNINPDHGIGQGFKATLVSLGVAAIWTVLFVMASGDLIRPNVNVFFGGLAAANLCGVVAAFFFCRNMSDYRKFEHIVNRRRR